MSTVLPTRKANDARNEAAQPAVQVAIQQIARNVRRVYLARTGPQGLPLPMRDVHPKAHGLVNARFRVLPESAFSAFESKTGIDLRRGVFRQPGREFEAVIRFSSSNKRPQSDTKPDGRGIALKLRAVEGEALELPRVAGAADEPVALTGDGGAAEQDFILLNGPAFFAKDAAEMVEASELEARDAFPGAFFVGRTAGFMALLAMAQNQANSPLDLTYFSQTPYALGEHVVKYRVRRKDGRPYPQKLNGSDGLRRALATEFDELAADGIIVLEFAVQVAFASDDFLVDDATQVWREDVSPFLPVAEVILQKQVVGTDENIRLADGLAFNPFQGLVAHEPLGSINRARGAVYEVSRKLRREFSAVPSEAAHIRIPGASVRRRTGVAAGWAGFQRWCAAVTRWWSKLMARLRSWLNDVLRRAGRFPMRILLKPWAGLIPLGLLLLLGVRAWCHPMQPMQLDLSGWMPSEAAIPEAVFRPEYATPGAQRKLNEQAEYVFRYEPTGSEFDGGVPYWIYRVLPRIAPERFDHAPDYSSVGLGPADDQDYYLDYHGLPRGLVMSDQMIHVLGNDVRIRIKMVSFNCASCHRGEFRDQDGQRTFADGMPNNVIDTAGYKERVYGTIMSSLFTADRVIEEIDDLLGQLYELRPRDARGRELPSRLTPAERVAYRLLVGEVKRRASKKDIGWVHERPENGPGRVDAFGALRFEFLGFDPKDKQISTVDLPSIWNEFPAMRPVQHWDGNTSDVRGRNFGAIIGVGGSPLSVHQRSVGEVAKWLGTLHPPAFPFERADPSLIAAGLAAYGHHCARCHGNYATESGVTRLVNATQCMHRGIEDARTDPRRLDAMDNEFVERLNRFGDRAGVWGRDAFQVPSGYVCPPLDGIWARAPYLHNGSVPTLHALLSPAADRPTEFYRGNTFYDPAAGGFRTELPVGDDARRAFLYRTAEAGNSAMGHEFGPGQPGDQRPPDEIEAERRALIAYLLTL